MCNTIIKKISFYILAVIIISVIILELDESHNTESINLENIKKIEQLDKQLDAQKKDKPFIIEETKISDSKYHILVLDSCEYIVYKWAGATEHTITHKGNCKFCIKRNNKNGN